MAKSRHEEVQFACLRNGAIIHDGSRFGCAKDVAENKVTIKPKILVPPEELIKPIEELSDPGETSLTHLETSF